MNATLGCAVTCVEAWWMRISVGNGLRLCTVQGRGRRNTLKAASKQVWQRCWFSTPSTVHPTAIDVYAVAYRRERLGSNDQSHCAALVACVARYDKATALVWTRHRWRNQACKQYCRPRPRFAASPTTAGCVAQLPTVPVAPSAGMKHTYQARVHTHVPVWWAAVAAKVPSARHALTCGVVRKFDS